MADLYKRIYPLQDLRSPRRQLLGTTKTPNWAFIPSHPYSYVQYPLARLPMTIRMSTPPLSTALTVPYLGLRLQIPYPVLRPIPCMGRKSLQLALNIAYSRIIGCRHLAVGLSVATSHQIPSAIIRPSFKRTSEAPSTAMAISGTTYLPF